MTPDRKIKIALSLSIALNVLVLVAVVSAFAFAPNGRQPGSGSRPSGGPPELQAFSRALDEPRREALRERLRSDPELRRGRTRMGESRRAVIKALRAEPFDGNVLRVALASQRNVQMDLSERGLLGLVEVVESLTPTERAAFVAALEELIRRPPR